MTETIEAKKRCTFCGEEILAVAVKCKHCGSDLLTKQEGQKIAKPADYGVVLLAIPIVGALLVWFWVSSMNLFQSPDSAMALIILGVVVGTAAIASLEASRNSMKTDRAKGTYGAVAWFFIISLFWVIGYPVYLFKRKHYGLTNLLISGIVVSVIFMGSWAVVASAIDAQKEKVRQSFDQMQNDLNNFQNGSN